MGGGGDNHVSRSLALHPARGADELEAKPPMAVFYIGLTFKQGSPTPTRSGRTRKALSGSRLVEQQDVVAMTDLSISGM